MTHFAPLLALLETATKWWRRLISTEAIFLAAALSFIPLLPSSASSALASEESSKTQEIWPVYSSAGEEGTVLDYSIWPFLAVERTPEWKQFSLRPFYVKREALDGSEERIQFLWPVYLYKRSEEDVTVRVLPIYTYRKDVYPYEDGHEYKVNYMLFPFLFGGSSTDEGGYFAFFPIGGNIKDFLGRDKIRFYLFPLYYEYSKNELRQRNYLWPVLSFSGGGDYNGFRLWPLYGYSEKQNEYRKEFALWPFYHHQKFDLDKEQSGERTMVFPLYAREDSERRRYRAFLWPLFSREENYARNFEEYSAPWPFVTISRGEDISQTRIWPLYGHTETNDSEKSFVLWPLYYRNIFTLDSDTERRETLLFPFWSSQSVLSGSKGTIRQKSRFWPFWKYRKFEDGATYTRILSLLWFDDEEGFERQYSPLWTIYERETEPDGSSHTYALWRLYRHKQTADGSETRIPLLFSHSEDAATASGDTTILGGILGSSRDGDERRLRILYFIDIPFQ
ncbi:hypothetical protein HZA56_17070 [Candidatus Poribacteria bacterium]|nr:hypothetical protein [Candidatus Poribacteria bacterium]